MRLRVATFNVHHCEGSDGIVDVERTAAALIQTEPDVVGLQELDRRLPRSGRADQPRDLGRLLDMDLRFFPTVTRGAGEYGIALGAASSLQDPRFVPLPRLGDEEPRGAVTAGVSGLHVVVTHLSTHRRVRAVQLAALAAIGTGLEGPAVIMGDLNLRSHSLAPLRRLGFSGVSGHSTLRGRRASQIDHILVSPEISILRSWTIPSEASDHLPLVADLEVPSQP